MMLDVMDLCSRINAEWCGVRQAKFQEMAVTDSWLQVNSEARNQDEIVPKTGIWNWLKVGKSWHSFMLFELQIVNTSGNLNMRLASHHLHWLHCRFHISYIIFA